LENAMAEKKSGRLMLRMDPNIHSRVANTAKKLGMDMNGLLNLIIREGLPRYEAEMHMLRDPKMFALWEKWRRLNPSRGAWEFFTDYFNVQYADYCFYATFQDGKRYMLNQTGDGFVEYVETPEGERSQGENEVDIPF
jgi:hypothetical protein